MHVEASGNFHYRTTLFPQSELSVNVDLAFDPLHFSMFGQGTVVGSATEASVLLKG
jgi:hypothetical protein